MSLISTFLRKWRALWRYGWQERLLLIPVFCLLGLARAMVLCLAFRRYVWIFGQRSSDDTPLLNSKQQKRTRVIGNTIRMVAKVTPWQSVCLPQAICACVLLRIYRVPFKVRFGVMPNENPDLSDPLLAHVWVKAGPNIPTGAEEHEKYTVVAKFCHA